MASVFSGKAGRNAAIWTADQAAQQLEELKQLYGDTKVEAGGYLSNAFNKANPQLTNAYSASAKRLATGYDRTNDFLRSGMAGALGQSNAGFTQGRQDITGATQQAVGALQGGYGQALGSLGQLYGQGASTLQGAADEWNPLIQQGQAGYTMLNNALGLNGQGGTAAAQQAFQTGPGYQFQVDEAINQSARAANRFGGVTGGNSRDAMTRLSSNLANQEYGNWLGRLQPYQAAAQSAVAGRGAVLGNLAQLYQNQGNNTATLQQSQGRDIGQLYTGQGTALAGLAQNQGTTNAGIVQQGYGAEATNAQNYAKQMADLRSQYGLNQVNLGTQYGGAMANLATGTAQGVADATNSYYNTVIPAGQQGMLAGQQAAANRMGALMGGLNFGSQLLGLGSGGAGSLLGGLFK